MANNANQPTPNPTATTAAIADMYAELGADVQPPAVNIFADLGIAPRAASQPVADSDLDEAFDRLFGN